MIKFMRNKLVSVVRKDEDTLQVHGVLDDDIYGVEVDVSMNIRGLTITSITGKWNRWTTPECPRAITFLKEAVGFTMSEDGFSQKVNKIVGRKSCRHFANILMECCHTAKEAIQVIRYEEEKRNDQTLTFAAFKRGNPQSEEAAPSPLISKEKKPLPAVSGPQPEGLLEKEETPCSQGMVIDLHVHSYPASPCSSVGLESLIVEAKRIGLGGICVTDHNVLWDPGEIQKLEDHYGFLVLQGTEITTDQGDILVFGLEEAVKDIIPLRDLRNRVQRAGGFMIVAHPFRGFLTFNVGQLGLTPEKAMERPLFGMVDAVETLNSKVTQKENGLAAQVAQGLGLSQTGGSDAHGLSEVGIYATQFAEGIEIRDEESLIQALRSRKYTPIAYRREKGY